MNLFTLRWSTRFITSLVKFTPALKKAKELKKTGVWENYKPFVDEQLYKWLNPLIDMADVKFIVNGKENIPQDEPVIYTPNHSSIFDIPAVLLNTPKPPMFMGKKELAGVPLIGDWMEVMDCVFVDRKNKSSAHSTLCDAIEMVKKGRSIVVFPEGTRSKTDEIGEFKGGAMKIAMETGAKVVPVVIDGAREHLEATGDVKRGNIFVTFLKPIDTKGLSKDDFFKMPAEIRTLIINQRAEDRAQRSK